MYPVQRKEGHKKKKSKEESDRTERNFSGDPYPCWSWAGESSPSLCHPCRICQWRMSTVPELWWMVNRTLVKLSARMGLFWSRWLVSPCICSLQQTLKGSLGRSSREKDPPSSQKVLLRFCFGSAAVFNVLMTRKSSFIVCDLIRFFFYVQPRRRLPSLPHTQDIKLVFLVFFLSQPVDSLQYVSVV